MAKSLDFGEINLEVLPGSARAAAVEDAEPAFRIVILGDFSGRASRGRPETESSLRGRRPRLVDRDNFDAVLRQSGAGIAIPLGDARPELRFETLDDFHPDRIFERAPLFQKLLELRSRLSNPSMFAETAAELGIVPGGEAAGGAPEPSAAPAPDVSQMASRSLLEDAISATEGTGAAGAPRGRPDELAAFIRRAAAPHLVARPDPRQAEWVGLIDHATSAEMRALLRLPDFRALEAAWRALFFLVRRIETDTALKLYVMDISKAELARDLAPAEDVSQTALYKLLVEEAVGAPGGEPWTVLEGNYTFHTTQDDLNLLARLAAIAAAAGAPFVAGAGEDLLGCASPAELGEPRKWKNAGPMGSAEARTWEALRRSPEASYLGLALPRFLLRLPYGKETDAVERFDFEEIAGAPSHDDYLWGNSALLCVSVLADAFAAEGWAMRPGRSLEIGGLPLHIYKQDGEPIAAPCAETLLTTEAADEILDAGLMPVAWLRGRDAVRLVRLQSIAKPLRPLAGRWS